MNCFKTTAHRIVWSIDGKYINYTIQIVYFVIYLKKSVSPSNLSHSNVSLILSHRIFHNKPIVDALFTGYNCKSPNPLTMTVSNLTEMEKEVCVLNRYMN